MPDNLRLGVRVTADTGQFQRGVRPAAAEMDKLGASVSRARQSVGRLATQNNVANAATRRAERAARQHAGAMSRAADAAHRQAAAQNAATAANQKSGAQLAVLHARVLAYAGGGYFAVTRLTGALTRQLDTYTDLNNRLRLVTDSETELALVRRRLLDISQSTRTALATNAELYNRIALSSDATGHSQAELLRVTELLNKQVLIGGNNASEAAAGLVQFAQGLASGRLQGDELRSVMENLLGVQQGLIEGFRILRERGQIDFDVTRANIRDLAAEGVLSADLILDAILASADDTERKFAQVEVTVSGATQRLGNAFLLMTGRIDEVTGASEHLVNALTVLTDVVEIVSGLETLERLNRQAARLESSLASEFLARGDRETQERLLRQTRARIAALEDERRLEQEIQSLRKAGIVEEETGAAGAAEPSAAARLIAESAALPDTRTASGDAFDAIFDEARQEQLIEDLERFQRNITQLEARAQQERAAQRRADRQRQLADARLFPDLLAEAQAGEFDRDYSQAAFDRIEAEQARVTRARLDAIEEIRRAEESAYDAARRAAVQWESDTLAVLATNEAAWEAHADAVAAITEQRLAQIATEEANHRLRESERWQDGARVAFEEYAREAMDAAENARQAISNSLQTMEDALVDFVTTGKLNFRSLVDSILADLARLVVRQAITGPISQALGGLFGGGLFGGGTDAAGRPLPVPGSVLHGGGTVGEPGGLKRLVDPQVFTHAARYHRGGVAGDEVPAILQRGEVVLSRRQVEGLGQAPMAPPVEIRFENRGTPQQPVEQSSRFDGRRWVISVVTDDLNTHGQIAQSLERGYGLRGVTT